MNWLGKASGSSGGGKPRQQWHTRLRASSQPAKIFQPDSGQIKSKRKTSSRKTSSSTRMKRTSLKTREKSYRVFRKPEEEIRRCSTVRERTYGRSLSLPAVH